MYLGEAFISFSANGGALINKELSLMIQSVAVFGSGSGDFAFSGQDIEDSTNRQLFVGNLARSLY